MHTVGGTQLKYKYPFLVHSHAIYLYMLLHIWFCLNYCMYAYTVISSSVYVLAGGRGVKTNWYQSIERRHSHYLSLSFHCD
jgi:hypothetical protein